MGEGYAILSVVAPVEASASTDPDTKMPVPSTPGSAVCAWRFVCTSEDEGKLVRVMLTCANELGAKATITVRATSPNSNLDLNVICSPFEVISKKLNQRAMLLPLASKFNFEIF